MFSRQNGPDTFSLVLINAIGKAALMQRQFVESSMMRTVGYDAGEQILEIEFKKSGRIYHYYKVEEEVFRELLAAESLGQYFRECIEGVYTYGRMR